MISWYKAMNLPNKLTLSRILLTFLFIFFILQKGLIALILATLVFFVAALTDYYDGYFAKKHNMISDFGKLMDPIADKFLILVAFFIFVHMHIIPLWMFLVILGREVLVTGLRIYAISKGKVIAAERAGKYKTVSQTVVIAVILLFLILNQFNLSAHWAHIGIVQRKIIYILLITTIALTLTSGLSYVWNKRELIYVK